MTWYFIEQVKQKQKSIIRLALLERFCEFNAEGQDTKSYQHEKTHYILLIRTANLRANLRACLI